MKFSYLVGSLCFLFRRITWFSVLFGPYCSEIVPKRGHDKMPKSGGIMKKSLPEQQTKILGLNFLEVCSRQLLANPLQLSSTNIFSTLQ